MRFKVSFTPPAFTRCIAVEPEQPDGGSDVYHAREEPNLGVFLLMTFDPFPQAALGSVRPKTLPGLNGIATGPADRATSSLSVRRAIGICQQAHCISLTQQLGGISRLVRLHSRKLAAPFDKAC